jgi:hypothetical protein
MIEEPGSNQDQKDDSKSAEIIAIPLFQKQQGSEPNNETATEGQDKTLKEDSATMNNFERKIAIIGIGLATITAVLFYVQLKEMTSQTQILSSQVQSAVASATQGARDTREQLTIARQQAKAAQDGVTAIQRQMRLDQRPWLRLRATGDAGNVDIGREITSAVTLQNTGKTAALSVLSELVIEKVMNGSKLTFPYIRPRNRLHAGAIHPGDPAIPQRAQWLKDDPQHRGGTIPRTLTADDVRDFAEGKAFLVIYGRVAYKDEFGINHWTHFCDWTTAEQKAKYYANACTAYNSVDKNF